MATRTARKSRPVPLARCSALQATALLAFASEHGDDWKRILSAGWIRAAFPGYLQQVRNAFGPDWLARVTIEDLQAFASPVDGK